MGMTIDEAIIQLRIQLTIWKEGCAFNLDNSPKAVETLIEIARKYQKIQEIVENSNGLLDGTLEHNKAFIKICEVIEDGKTN